MGNSGWIDASVKSPCVNCGKAGWCRSTPSGDTIICMRQNIPGGIERTDKSGQTYWLKSKENKISTIPSYSKSKPELPAVANSLDRDRVYRFFLEKLTLDSHHLQHLLNRGLTAESVATRGYKTLKTNGRRTIYQLLEKEFGQSLLKTIPGIILKNGIFTIGGASGIVIPIRSEDNLIVGIVTRPDIALDGNKYLWLSSGKNGGPSSGRHIHVPLTISATDSVHITEGSLKADIATELSGSLTIGIPGISGYERIVEILTSLNTKEAIVALDADAIKNEHVAKAALDVFNLLSSAGFKVGYKTWNLQLAKGYDDALFSNVEMKTLFGDEAQSAISALQLPAKSSKLDIHQRPELHYGLDQMHELIQACWEIILKHNSPEKLFRNGSSVVMIGDTDNKLQIIYVDQIKMFGHLVRTADWFEDREAYVKGGRQIFSSPSIPPKDLVKDMLAFVDPKLPRLTSIIEAPSFGKNGKLICDAGYDKENGVYLDPKRMLKIPEIKAENSEKLRERIKFLREEVFGDFPFATKSDFCHLIASLVTGVMREMIHGPTPLVVLNASSPGSGKSLLAELMALILTGAVTEARAIPKSDDELRKAITSELMRAPRIILFDNADQESDKIHSPTLAAVLTATVWTDRILSQSKMTSLENSDLLPLTRSRK